MKIPHAYIRA